MPGLNFLKHWDRLESLGTRVAELRRICVDDMLVERDSVFGLEIRDNGSVKTFYVSNAPGHQGPRTMNEALEMISSMRDTLDSLNVPRDMYDGPQSRPDARGPQGYSGDLYPAMQGVQGPQGSNADLYNNIARRRRQRR